MVGWFVTLDLRGGRHSDGTTQWTKIRRWPVNFEEIQYPLAELSLTGRHEWCHHKLEGAPRDTYLTVYTHKASILSADQYPNTSTQWTPREKSTEGGFKEKGDFD
jgi:hypothetical protein